MTRPATLPPQFAFKEVEEDVCTRLKLSDRLDSRVIGSEAVSALIAFFRTLDAWDREAKLQ